MHIMADVIQPILLLCPALQWLVAMVGCKDHGTSSSYHYTHASSRQKPVHAPLQFL